MNDRDNGEMRWFGESWGSGLNEDCDQQPTPVGEPCLWCEEAVADGDSGVTVMQVSEQRSQRSPCHLECWLRILFGSVAHQQGRCTCPGGVHNPEGEDALDAPVDGHDDTKLTKREAARAAVAHYRQKVGN